MIETGTAHMLGGSGDCQHFTLARFKNHLDLNLVKTPSNYSGKTTVSGPDSGQFGQQ
jgi:hypothetical protein